MYGEIRNPAGLQLQATLSASSANSTITIPHHPITCSSQLRLNEDNVLECDHAKVASNDPRTRICLDHSIAILLLEEAFKKFG